MKNLTEFEQHLAELVHYLSRGTKKEMGMTMREIEKFLYKPIPSRNGKTALDCIHASGRLFLNELKIFMNEKWGG